MIEDDEEDKLIDINNINFYDNTGIRKAILLCKYVDLIKQWIESDKDKDNNPNLNVSNKHKQIHCSIYRSLSHYSQWMVLIPAQQH